MNNNFYFYIGIFIIPLIMIFFGLLFTFKPPRKINYFYGYRTNMSMKNEETWFFAHKFLGKLWAIYGILMAFIITVILLIINNVYILERFSDKICILEIIFLILPIIFTERALKKVFDKTGKRK